MLEDGRIWRLVRPIAGHFTTLNTRCYTGSTVLCQSCVREEGEEPVLLGNCRHTAGTLGCWKFKIRLILQQPEYEDGGARAMIRRARRVQSS